MDTNDDWVGTWAEILNKLTWKPSFVWSFLHKSQPAQLLNQTMNIPEVLSSSPIKSWVKSVKVNT